jgi:hypothetical protein
MMTMAKRFCDGAIIGALTFIGICSMGARSLPAGEPEDGWMKAIRSGAVTSAWARAEGGRILSAGLGVVTNAGVEGVLTTGAAGGRDVMIADSSDPEYTGPRFIYCDLPDWLRPIPRVEIVIEYFDAGPGEISIDYSSTTQDSAKLRGPPFLTGLVLTGCNRWRVARIALLDAAFRKKINGHDFRILADRKTFLVRTVAVLPLGELDKMSANVRQGGL